MKAEFILKYGRLAAPIIGQSIAQSLKRLCAESPKFESWREMGIDRQKWECIAKGTGFDVDVERHKIYYAEDCEYFARSLCDVLSNAESEKEREMYMRYWTGRVLDKFRDEGQPQRVKLGNAKDFEEI